MTLLGLDVSTSVVGTCVLSDDGAPVLLDRIDLRRQGTTWGRADEVKRCLVRLRDRFPDIHRVIVEEPLVGFRTGMSSAQTICTLVRFNGIVSYIARDVFGVDPTYVSAAHARKLCGIKLVKTAVGGPQKEQVFTHMQANDLSHVAWATKKSGAIVDWSRDACDAYVVAKAAFHESMAS